MANVDAAKVSLAKARQDEYLLELPAGDVKATDETFGFHAQQAVEKLLKAALAAQGRNHPRTHRLGDLLSRRCA